jgi:membrane protein YqaA with SNARE-associated domain
VVGVWTAIGVFNKLVYYEAGERGGDAALNKVHGYTPERANKFNNLNDRWGSILLLLASIPVIGSLVTVLGGVSRVTMPVFIIMAVISDLVRNWLIIFLSGEVAGLFQ